MNEYSKDELRQLWELRIAEMNELGISQSEYARQNDIPASTISYWVNKLKKDRMHVDSTDTDNLCDNVSHNRLQSTNVSSWLTIVPDADIKETVQHECRFEHQEDSWKFQNSDLCMNRDISIRCGCFTVSITDAVNPQLLDVVLRVVAAI